MKKIITITIDSARAPHFAKHVKLLDQANMQLLKTPDCDSAWVALGRVAAACGEITITEQCIWVAGWNVPGYLPECEPMEFNSWVEARDHLVTALIENDTSASGFDHAENARARKGFNAAEVGKPFWVQSGKYAWWIAQEQ